MAREPASIRYNNPGAMWGGNALARKWGATANIPLADGTGQGNTIAFFPSKVRGAAAQFDLWRSSKNYRGKPLAQAIRTWSGGNHVSSYLAFLKKRVYGLADDTVVGVDSYLGSPYGIAFMKAQAWHEAGKPYPMSDAEWAEGQRLALSGAASKATSTPIKKATPAGTGTAAGTVAHQSGFDPMVAIVIGVVVTIAAFVVYKYLQNKHQKALDAEIAKVEAAIAEAQKTAVEAPVATPEIEATKETPSVQE